MEQKDLISIIVPIYKVEDYLDQCIESICNQTYNKLEIILVDDGSPDCCGDICNAWSEKDCRIRVVHKANGGLSDARNAGLEIATGEYIAFVDSDDVIHHEMFSVLLTTMLQSKADIVECGIKEFQNTVIQDEIPAMYDICNFNTVDALRGLLDESIFDVLFGISYIKNIFDKLRFEKGKLHEDVFFTYQAFGGVEYVAKIKIPLYYYRQRAGSIMGTAFSGRNLDALEAQKQRYVYMREKYPELSGLAQEKLLNACIYFGQKALCSKNKNLIESVFAEIKPIFKVFYKAEKLQTNAKQKIWYRVGLLSLLLCCKLRNYLKVGL